MIEKCYFWIVVQGESYVKLGNHLFYCCDHCRGIWIYWHCSSGSRDCEITFLLIPRNICSTAYYGISRQAWSSAESIKNCEQELTAPVTFTVAECLGYENQ